VIEQHGGFFDYLRRQSQDFARKQIVTLKRLKNYIEDDALQSDDQVLIPILYIRSVVLPLSLFQ
jgi:hypothetical protein